LSKKNLNIICLGHAKGRIHDFKLLKNSRVKFGELVQVIADKGYQGITKIHEKSETPIKKPKRKVVMRTKTNRKVADEIPNYMRMNLAFTMTKPIIDKKVV
jgi:hypothetical protein